MKETARPSYKLLWVLTMTPTAAAPAKQARLNAVKLLDATSRSTIPDFFLPFQLGPIGPPPASIYNPRADDLIGASTQKVPIRERDSSPVKSGGW